jgi:hypothetical protein
VNALRSNLITCLDLDEYPIGDIGVKYIAKLFKEKTSITNLTFNYNNISDTGKRFITEAIKYNYFLINLTFLEILLVILEHSS